jgi:hypothetical protein
MTHAADIGILFHPKQAVVAYQEGYQPVSPVVGLRWIIENPTPPIRIRYLTRFSPAQAEIFDAKEYRPSTVVRAFLPLSASAAWVPGGTGLTGEFEARYAEYYRFVPRWQGISRFFEIASVLGRCSLVSD